MTLCRTRFGRGVIAAAMLGAMVFAVVALSVSPAPASSGSNCTYYNNAAHTTVVGQFGKDCCNNPIAWGIKTKYSSCGGCFICFPPPPR